MSTSHISGAKGLQRLICFKYYIILNWISRFSWGLDAAKKALFEQMLQIKVDH